MAELTPEISAILIKWYKTHKRDLPWRNTNNAYYIWLSEVILQQTQVIQGLNYYLKFTETYPKIEDLARAPQDEVLKLWQGLGYYSRARNLHQTAKYIVSNYNGKFPSKFEDIIQLKGIGIYTASAICSFAFNLPYAVVDGNVYRVLSRLYDINTPINSGVGQKQFQNLANTLIHQKQPGIYNQAIMEFGSQLCRPTNPDCNNCPLSMKCLAFAHKTILERPVKIGKIKIKNRYLNYFLIVDKFENVFIKQRANKDIWQGLYELFLIETNAPSNLLSILENTELKGIIGKKHHISNKTYTFKHILTHQHLHANFYIIYLQNKLPNKYLQTPYTKLTNFAWPRLIDKFLKICTLEQ